MSPRVLILAANLVGVELIVTVEVIDLGIPFILATVLDADNVSPKVLVSVLSLVGVELIVTVEVIVLIAPLILARESDMAMVSVMVLSFPF